jgi:hypothetical protein
VEWGIAMLWDWTTGPSYGLTPFNWVSVFCLRNPFCSDDPSFGLSGLIIYLACDPGPPLPLVALAQAITGRAFSPADDVRRDGIDYLTSKPFLSSVLINPGTGLGKRVSVSGNW